MVSLIVATMSYAQKSLIATLSHENNISTYYGSRAFSQAYDAAVDGDIITLSKGKFICGDIYKALTIRGAGMDGDNETIITNTNNSVAIFTSTSSENPIIFEGLSIPGRLSKGNGAYNNTTIKKCKIKTIIVPSNSKLTIIDSRITNCIDLSEGNSGNKSSENCTVSCINSIICNPYKRADNSTFNFVNCVLYFSNPFWGVGSYSNTGSLSYLTYSLFENTIVFFTSTFPETCVVNNSIIVNNNTDIFKNFNGSITENSSFELTDAAKAANIGSDGTEIGIHGGLYPWNSRPSYPVITKFDVSSKVSADDKLSVDIIVNGAE